MSSDYYSQSKGPASDSNNSIQMDGLLLRIFCIVLLSPVALHFLDTIFSYTRTILLILVWRLTTGLNLLCGLYDIFRKLWWLQPVQQKHTVKFCNKNKPRKDQTAPPSEDFLQLAVQQIQFTSSIEELKHPLQYQATIQEQQLMLLPSPTVQLTPVSTTPVAKSDHALLEFIKGEDHWKKFINQDLTFLQPSQIQQPFKFNDQITNPHKNTVDKRKQIRLPEGWRGQPQKHTGPNHRTHTGDHARTTAPHTWKPSSSTSRHFGNQTR